MSDIPGSVNPDAHVDEEIISCMNVKRPKSFFLFAGAGSGKTTSLVKLLKGIRDRDGEFLRKRNRRVAVITYTNAACDTIKARLDLDDLFTVRTIHSFVWELIKPFQDNIREWVKILLTNDISGLEQEIAETKNTKTKTYAEYQRKLSSKRRRLSLLDSVKVFTYNPNGDNFGRDSLVHSEVIGMGADFILNLPLMQTILIQKFPLLLIDESQDTNKQLIESFLAVQASHSDSFAIGLIGDMMQRIYFDGKPNLSKVIPENWARPTKIMNYRCPQRVIRLINQIRKTVDDGIEQQAPKTKEDGHIRLFVATTGNEQKQVVERKVREKMAELCNDPLWDSEDVHVKFLALEHHMAASRLGFLPFFEPLYKIDRYKTGVIDGTLQGLGFFTKQILPLIRARRAGDDFAVAQVVKASSKLLDRNSIRKSENRGHILETVKTGIESILNLWSNGADPKAIDVLRSTNDTGIFEIPTVLELLLNSEIAVPPNQDQDQDETNIGDETSAWIESLANPFSMIEAYEKYISGNAAFDTHQGVKGLEFDRVMVIADDEEAKGFMFSYDKLFGVKGKSVTDIRNENEGKETGIDRTTRLFYVTCSRAIRSLAVVAYTTNVETARRFAIDSQWFAENEIEVIV